jgi:alpha-galactosidase
MADSYLHPLPTPEAMEHAAQWLVTSFADGVAPFAFCYGGIPSEQLLPQWNMTRERRHPAVGRNEETITYRDPMTGLVVRCEVTVFTESAAIEWVVYFRNDGQADTLILEEIQALRTRFHRGPDGEFVLHRALGSQAKRTDFAPVLAEPSGLDRQSKIVGEILKPETKLSFATSGGRSSNAYFPFFNLEWAGQGVIVGIGWSGQWAASVIRDKNNGVTVSAGMEQTHLLLHPGEEIRSPRILLLFWSGDRIRGHNQLRRFLLTHHIPRRDGEPIIPPIAAMGWFIFDPESPGVGVSEQNQIAFLRCFRERGIPIEDFWLDAGWYDNDGTWHRSVGNWYPNPRNFPHGLRPVADAAHELGMRFIVWFEPERVYEGTQIDREHPQWLLRLSDSPNRLFNLGNPEARRWLTDLISSIIAREGIDVYRHDFNVDPLPYWRANDTPDRQGITEIRYVEGLYAFWDELLRRHPGLLIDNCVSGGRRIDLETMSRSIPLWRTDYFFEPTGLQAHTWAINHYIPISCTGTEGIDPYEFRSALSSGIVVNWDPRQPNFPVEQARRNIEEQKRLRQFFLGDFYPLTAHSVGLDTWMAYQFDRPDLGQGVILVFRRDESPYRAATLKLGGLLPEATYELTFEDTGERQTYRGRDLAEGLEVVIDRPHTSLLITYNRQETATRPELSAGGPPLLG